MVYVLKIKNLRVGCDHMGIASYIPQQKEIKGDTDNAKKWKEIERKPKGN